MHHRGSYVPLGIFVIQACIMMLLKLNDSWNAEKKNICYEAKSHTMKPSLSPYPYPDWPYCWRINGKGGFKNSPK